MTPRQAARHYVASLIERQLAKAHVGSRGDVGGDRPIVLDTFDNAPPNVRAALDKGLDGDAVAGEMARFAEEIRREALLEQASQIRQAKIDVHGSCEGREGSCVAVALPPAERAACERARNFLAERE